MNPIRLIKIATSEKAVLQERILVLERMNTNLLASLNAEREERARLETALGKIEAEAMGGLGGARSPRAAMLTIAMLARRGSGGGERADRVYGWEATQAQKRPANFKELTTEEQWEIDKRLGILDWDGK